MALYVDNMRAPYGRMVMCHMMADSTDELLRAATALGLQHKWLQKAGTPHEHFDVSLGKRQMAVELLGAQVIGMREIVDLMEQRRGVRRASG